MASDRFGCSGAAERGLNREIGWPIGLIALLMSPGLAAVAVASLLAVRATPTQPLERAEIVLIGLGVSVHLWFAIGLIHGLVMCLPVQLLLHRKRVAPAAHWLWGPTMIVAVVTGPLLGPYAAVATAVSWIVTALVLRFALQDRSDVPLG